MYLDYFSLNRHPFRITPDPSLFFPGGQDGRGVILNALIYGITSGEGILKVVGEVGSGKTMLCRMLEEELPDTVEIVYIANPSLSAREILYAIAMELKLEVSASTERLNVLHLLQNYLLEKHAQGDTVVVFIEEAQSMPLETLEEIRLLSNLETYQHKLMQIVLFGQPELDKILAQKNIRQLRERITHSFTLEPLSALATSEYLQYRLKVAGCPRPDIFSPLAVKMIAKASTGLTRRINILADKSLLAAYADSPARQAPLDGDAPLVLPRHVKAAIRDSDYRNKYLNHWLFIGLGSAFLLFAIGVGVKEIFLPAPGQAPVQVAADTAAASAQVAAQGVVARDEDNETRNDEAPQSASAQEAQEVAADTNRERGPGLAATTGPGDDTVATDIASPEAATAQPVPENAPLGEEPLVLARQELPESPDQAEAGSPAPEPQTAPEVAGPQAEEVTTPFRDTAPDAVEVADAGTVTDPEPVPEVAQEAGEVESTTGIASAGVKPAPEPEPDPLTSPVTILPAGLAELRMEPTAAWLRELGSKSGYTIQLFSVPSTNPNGLEEYLQFLQLISLLDDTYICFMPVSSPSSGRWQVMHKEFQGVTPARSFIASLPVYIQQYDPYVRNLSGIECSYPVRTGN